MAIIELWRGAARVAATIVALLPLPAAATPATFSTALPVSEGHAMVRQQFIAAEADRDSERVEERSLETIAGYGISPDLALFASLPWIDRELHSDTAGTRSVSGFGDARVFARYTLLRRDGHGQTFRLAPFVGAELPTGEDSAADRLGPVPAGLQPGSGSLDPFVGVVGSLASTQWNLDAQLAWQDNRSDDQQAQGDEFRADLSYQRRLLPTVIDAGTRGFLFGGVELNYVDRRRDRLAHLPIAGTAAERLFVTPVVQYSQRHWMAEAALQIPVTQSVDGSNYSQDYVLRFGLRAHL